VITFTFEKHLGGKEYTNFKFSDIMSYRAGILYSEEKFPLEYINKALFDAWNTEAESLAEMMSRNGNFTNI
jgi:hypothetical protein